MMMQVLEVVVGITAAVVGLSLLIGRIMEVVQSRRKDNGSV
jgi:hypothetical protein